MSSPSSPLLLEPVLEVIFDHMTESDLLNCRLVCKQWKNEVDRSVTKRRSIIIEDPDDLEMLIDFLESHPERKISCLAIKDCSLEEPEIMQLLERVKPTLSDLRLDDCMATKTTYDSIIRFIGQQLQKLDLGTIKTWENVYHSYFPVYEEETEPTGAHGEGDHRHPIVFPNMKCLEFYSYNQYEEKSTMLSKVVECFPNLVKLVATNLVPEDPDLFKKFQLPYLKTLTLVDTQLYYHRYAGTTARAGMSLRELYMAEGGIRDQHIQAFINMNVKLREIHLTNLHSSVDKTLLKNFLESHQDTLKYLWLHNLPIPTEDPSLMPPAEAIAAPSPFPCLLPNVTNILIDKPFIRNIAHVLNSFPRLHQASLYFPMKSKFWPSVLPNRLQEYENIHVLVLNWIEPKPLKQLALSLQKLVELRLKSADNALLQVVYEYWPNLRVLELDDGDPAKKVSDEGITGLRSNSKERDAGTLFLGSLTKLASLSLKCSGPTMRSLCVLRYVKSLEFVEMRAKISAKSIEALKKCGFLDCGINCDGCRILAKRNSSFLRTCREQIQYKTNFGLAWRGTFYGDEFENEHCDCTFE